MNQYSFVVACIAVGRLYRSWARAMIETVRTNGGYDGIVHVLTDKPCDFRNMDHVVTIQVAPRQHVIAIKTYKTRLFDLIDAKEILYLDVDVLVALPLHTWHGQTIRDVKNLPIAVFPDTGMGATRCHTGIMLMTSAAVPVLSQWRAALMSGKYDRDQDALRDILPSDKVFLMSEEHLLFPDDESMKRRYVRTFVHITFTGRQRCFSMLSIRRYMSKALNCLHMPDNCRIASLPGGYIQQFSRYISRLAGAKNYP